MKRPRVSQRRSGTQNKVIEKGYIFPRRHKHELSFLGGQQAVVSRVKLGGDAMAGIGNVDNDRYESGQSWTLRSHEGYFIMRPCGKS